MSLMRSCVLLASLCALVLMGACDERWSPGEGDNSCALDQPALQGPLWNDTFKQKGWAAGCLFVRGDADKPVFTKAIKLDLDRTLWAFETPAADKGPLHLRLPDELRGADVSFEVMVAGRPGQQVTDMAGFCQSLLNLSTAPCEARGPEKGCWFSMQLQLTLPDGTRSRPLAASTGYTCVLQPPNVDEPGEVVIAERPIPPHEVSTTDASPDALPPDTPVSSDSVRPSDGTVCKPFTFASCEEMGQLGKPCKGQKYCDNGQWGRCIFKETCGNQQDDDCDGDIDEGCVETIAGQPGKPGNLDGAVTSAMLSSPSGLTPVSWGGVFRGFAISENPDPGKGRLRLLYAPLSSGSSALTMVKTVSVSLGPVGDLGVFGVTATSFQVAITSPGTDSISVFKISTATLDKISQRDIASVGGVGWGVALSPTLGSDAGIFAGDRKLFQIDLNTGGKIIKTLALKVFGVAVNASTQKTFDVFYTAGTCVRRFQVNEGVIGFKDSHLAGDCGATGNVNGSFISAKFGQLGGIALSKDHTRLYVADQTSHHIREINLSTQQVRLLVGKSQPQGGYRDDTYDQAQFHTPTGLAVGDDGYLYIADTGNHVIRRFKLKP